MLYSSFCIRGTKPPFRGILKYKDEDGVWKQTSVTLEARGKAAARRELLEARDELEERTTRELGRARRRNQSVGSFMDEYVDSLEGSQAIERSTVTAYRSITEHIREGMGDIMLLDLRHDDIQRWENGLNARGLKPATVRKAHVLLKSALKQAVMLERLDRNPAEAVRPPKLPAYSPNALDDAQRRRLMAFLDQGAPTTTNLAVRMALMTGLREGEICGLRWCDVDLEARTLWARQAIARDHGRFYVKPPKTAGSMRDIPMPADLVGLLDIRRRTMLEGCVEAGVQLDGGLGQLYVLGGVDGSFLHPHEVWRQWKAIASCLELMGTQGRVPTFHDLRHTFATAAIAEGVDVKTVSSILGHTNAAMTLNVYASADPTAKRAAAETIGEVMGRRPEPTGEVVRFRVAR
ncbi:MAG: tyrosine-type recombinase/integrase [Atopobiaceae bacterium]|jgi:integrase|nr:site-specific integrase [Atopobiaceae bacterium]MCH4215134.1 site-specific integrase [Atopobiaceae bacterium]MCH4277253.1 site-specific integrase [Atopobiaceae bacterium]MCI1225906.1 site-specific integrase [Atopobiaceae bacterium]MCI1260544.1 site-specific integrase [Atopobiaceae bacterium]